MARRFAWLSLTALLMGGACEERLTAPGACPAFCPDTRITVVDTLLRTSVVRDSSYRGFVPPHRASRLQVVSDGASPRSRAVVAFPAFSERIVLVTGDTLGSEIVALDSFRIQFSIVERPDEEGLDLVVHRLPVGVDSTATLDQLAPFFDDSTLVTTVAIPDTLEGGEVVTATFPGDRLPTFDEDGRRVAVGVRLRAPGPTFVDVGALTGGSPALLTRFVQVDSAGAEVVSRDDAEQAEFDTFVADALPAPAPQALVIGGIPSARAILRFDLPAAIMDSAEVVRATILLVSTEPAPGAPGDAFLLRAEGLAADFGAKSPIVPGVPGLGEATVTVGSADMVEIDITHLVQPWQRDSTAARSISVRALPEAAAVGELRVGSSRSGAAAPLVRITFVPEFDP